MEHTIVILFVVAVFGIAFWIRSRIRHHRIQKRAQHGHIMESRAGDMLKSWGFRIIERNPKIQYTWWIDQRPVNTSVEADYLVSADGKRWLVEVKTGRAARPNRRETRRQLLEYSNYGDADGLYLLDADEETLELIEFPVSKKVHRTSMSWVCLFFFILGGFFGLFCAFWD